MFYRPENSVAADVIPFYRDGAFQLFYLRDFRSIEKYGEGTPWYLLETEDFVHFWEKGEVISRGKAGEQDLYIFTGSVFETQGIHYIFYTGHNPHYIGTGKKQEVILRAVSRDFKSWEKDEEFALEAPDCFEPHDFRDPFVFYNEETREYNMLLAARLKEGPERRRGCTAVAVSRDLDHWSVKETPFYAPGMYFTHECPDLFRIGEWWYLVFSEFTEKCETHYRMSKSLSGPWLTPENDTFDNRNFYAAKTVSDGRERYVIGWNPTNQEDKDFEETQWGGNIIVHRIIQEEDGQLSVCIPDTVKAAYRIAASWEEGNRLGEVTKKTDGWEIGRPDGYSSLDLGALQEQCRISFDVSFDDSCKNFYVFLNSDPENERAYYAGIDLAVGRMTFDRWPRKRNDYPFMLELEKKIDVRPDRTYHMDLLRDGAVLEVYFDHRYAMSARMNDFAEGSFGLAASFGKSYVKNLEYLMPGSDE